MRQAHRICIDQVTALSYLIHTIVEVDQARFTTPQGLPIVKVAMAGWSHDNLMTLFGSPDSPSNALH